MAAFHLIIYGRFCVITEVILGKRLTNFQGLISGVPVHSNRSDLKEEPAQEPEIGSKG